MVAGGDGWWLWVAMKGGGLGCVLGWFMVGGWLMVVMGGEWWW